MSKKDSSKGKERNRPSDDVWAFATLPELSAALAAGRTTSVELTEVCLSRLRRIGLPLNAVATLMEESALQAARRADAERKSGVPRRPLHGIPYAAKDLLDTKGVATTWGSPLFRDRVPASDATAIARLAEAGAILVAKLAMVELAGGAGYRFASASAQGPGKNPWNPKHWTGGSSSGSGAAVGAGLVPFALGSETWGSIVCPSTYCGVSGLRPTYGRVSRHGAMPLCFTLDKIGPLAHTAEDLETVLEAIAGEDPADPSTLRGKFTRSPAPERLRIGVLPDRTWDGYQKEAVALADAALKTLESKGHRLLPVKLPDFPFEAVLLAILASEAAASFEPLVASGRHLELVDPLSKTGLLPGTTISAADYANALRRRTLAIRAMAELFTAVDVLVGPSFPSSASPIEANLETWYALPSDPLGAPGNLCGLPAASVPCGFDAAGLPLGVTFMGAVGNESLCLAAAKAYQRETDWHRRRPPV
ncbi:MAG TPA: amidase [Thermoanaerobaculia bacterium]|nr:amidase [Thermoanaerobaculia bacterium]